MVAFCTLVQVEQHSNGRSQEAEHDCPVPVWAFTTLDAAQSLGLGAITCTAEGYTGITSRWALICPVDVALQMLAALARWTEIHLQIV